ncbi:vacuolar protein sorting-associated protein 26C-like [Symsagittifera roscoffensis]|uniref:vacuolar protein sorting-associated protein 26C-like n=1 Tax=Symsagittifera roscoffensis TaxID=84072 RepID=UPI00307CA3F7
MSTPIVMEIKLKRVNKIYREGESLSGILVINSKTDLNHQGINLYIDGTVGLSLSSKNVGVFEAFYNSVKPVNVLHYTVEVAKSGKLPNGKTEFPFEVPLSPKSSAKMLYETYQGVYVNVSYTIKSEMKTGLLKKDKLEQVEFFVEYPPVVPEDLVNSKYVDFSLEPEKLKIKDKNLVVPDFKVVGTMDNTVHSILKPYTGTIKVVHSHTPIRSIEVQLVRVETCGCAEGYSKDVTEIQNIQIADGDVCRGLDIPIYMIFPRLFSCPSVQANNFKIEFEVNLVIVFNDSKHTCVTENFPILIGRY